MDLLGIISTIIVYAGFVAIQQNMVIAGVLMLLASNIGWIVRGIKRRDWNVVLWQAGFVIINLRWIWLEWK